MSDPKTKLYDVTLSSKHVGGSQMQTLLRGSTYAFNADQTDADAADFPRHRIQMFKHEARDLERYGFKCVEVELSDSLESMTVKQLRRRAFAVGVELPAKAKKDEILSLLQAALESDDGSDNADG